MYSSAVLTNDPTLANFQTWDLMVTTDGNWASAGIRATLPAGQFFYKNALGGNTKPNSAFFSIAPALEFTSYVSAPSDNGTNNATNVLGSFPEGSPDGPSIGNATQAPPGVPGNFNFAYGDLVNDPPYPAPGQQIVRLTFPLGVIPDIANDPPNPSNTSEVNPDNTVTIPDIPEPTTLGFAGAAALFALRRRI